MPAVSVSAYRTEEANKKYLGVKMALVIHVPLDAGLLVHLLPKAVVSQQLTVQRKREGNLEETHP